MKYRIKNTQNGILPVLLLCTAMAFAYISAHFETAWSRFAGGGGTRQSANYEVQDILGQWVLETSTGPNAQIVSGFFWTGDSPPQPIYLPTVIRH